MKHRPEWWFLMVFATFLFAAIGWFLLKGLLPEHAWLFIIFYFGFVVLGDGITAIASEKYAPSKIHVGPGERGTINDTPSETAVAVRDFDAAGFGKVKVRGEEWRAVVQGEVGVSRGDELRVLRRDGLTLHVERDRRDL